VNGYRVSLSWRRTGARETAQSVFMVSDAALARARRAVLFILSAALFLLAPLAMAALTSPERGEKDLPPADIYSALPHFS
jgi:hypothetical protein